MTGQSSNQASQAELIDLITRLKLVADGLKSFTVKSMDARSLYGINDSLMAELMSLGLPHEQRDHSLTFDENDLYNVALYLRLPSVHRTAMRSWASTLEQFGQAEEQLFHLEYRVLQSPLLVESPRKVTAVVSPTEKRYVYVWPGETALEIEVPIRAVWPLAPPQLEEVIIALSGRLEFFALPEALTTTTIFSQTNGLAECAVGSRMLRDECESLGFEARQMFGLFLSVPVAFPTTWTEVLLEGEWVPFDPLLLNLLHLHTRLSTDSWPITRSLGSIVLPMANNACDLVTYNGQTVPTSYITKLVTAGL